MVSKSGRVGVPGHSIHIRVTSTGIDCVFPPKMVFWTLHTCELCAGHHARTCTTCIHVHHNAFWKPQRKEYRHRNHHIGIAKTIIEAFLRTSLSPTKSYSHVCLPNVRRTNLKNHWLLHDHAVLLATSSTCKEHYPLADNADTPMRFLKHKC